MALTLKQALTMFWEQIQARFVKRENGKGLSTNDFTTEEKNKLASLENTTVDTTLTMSNAAADAKTVGEALAEKQPKGNYALKSEIPSMEGLATETYVNTKVASLVDSAPETLNTLNELSAALGDDPNFATTVATKIGELETAVDSFEIPNSNLVNGNTEDSLRMIGSCEESNEYVMGESALALGIITRAEGDGSISEGMATIANGLESHAAGFRTYAGGDYSYAGGNYSSATAEAAYAAGTEACAHGRSSHAEGQGTVVEASFGHVEGIGTVVIGEAAHGEGESTFAEEESSHTEGRYTSARGIAAHAEGYGEYVWLDITGEANTLTYTYEVYEGSDTDIYPGASIRAYTVDVLRDADSYTDLKYRTAHYKVARVVSVNTSTKTITLNKTLSSVALDEVSADVFIGTVAHSDASHAEGYSTIAGGFAQHAEGSLNAIDPSFDPDDTESHGKYLHITGNGTAINARSNAYALDWNGNAYYAGDVYVAGDGKNDFAGSKKLATEEYVNNAATSIDATLTQEGAAADAKTVGDRLKPTRIQDFKTLGPLTTLGENMQGSVYIFTDYPDWPEEDCAAFLLEGKRYPLIIGGKTYLAYTKNGGENVGLYLGNPALSYNDNLKALGNSGEDFVIYRHPDPTDVSSPYIFLGYKDSLSSTNIQLFYPVSDQVIDELGIIEDDLAAVPKSLVPTNLQNGIAEGSLRAVGSIEESDNYKLGKYSVAEGYLCKAPGNWAHAEGYRTQAIGNDSHAENFDTIAVGKYSHAEGHETYASGAGSHAEGLRTYSFGSSSHTEGGGSTNAYTGLVGITGEANATELTVTLENDWIFGRIAINTLIRYIPEDTIARIIDLNGADHKLILDKALSSNAINSSNVEADFQFITGVQAIGDYSHAEGNNTWALGVTSHAENYQTKAVGTYSHAEGIGTEARGNGSHAEGQYGIALGESSHVQNSQGTAPGAYFSGTKAANTYTTSHGWRGVQPGQYLIYQDKIAKVLDIASDDDLTFTTVTLDRTFKADVDLVNEILSSAKHVAAGAGSTVMGENNIANGADSFAGGHEGIINGNYSFGYGTGIITNLENNFCIGKYNYDNDQGTYSEVTSVVQANSFNSTDKFAVTNVKPVFNNTAIYTVSNVTEKLASELVVGDYILFSYAEYLEITSVTTNPNWAFVPYSGTTYKIVQGQGEQSTNAFVIGNGNTESRRSNAHTVDWDGNAWYSGDVYVGSNSGTNKDAGSKKLATEEFVLQNSSSNIVVSSTAPNNPAVGTIWFQV